jgi:hypothetical protein
MTKQQRVVILGATSTVVPQVPGQVSSPVQERTAVTVTIPMQAALQLSREHITTMLPDRSTLQTHWVTATGSSLVSRALKTQPTTGVRLRLRTTSMSVLTIPALKEMMTPLMLLLMLLQISGIPSAFSVLSVTVTSTQGSTMMQPLVIHG